MRPISQVQIPGTCSLLTGFKITARETDKTDKIWIVTSMSNWLSIVVLILAVIFYSYWLRKGGG